MKVHVALPNGVEVEEEMPEGPHVNDRLYNLLGRACVIVYKRDWFRRGNGLDWRLRVWVR